MLERDGLERAPIEQALAALEEIPENERVTIAPGLDVINWIFSKIDPDLSRGITLDPLVPLKIAFEFVALCLGGAIYVRNPALAPIRSGLLMQEKLDESVVSVEFLHAPKYAPFHGIGNESSARYEIVQIRLFGRLAYRVHFRKLRIDGPQYAYTHSLKGNVDDLRVSG